ncbi:uncharacterized protein HD556DRAFT_1449297 [Suillus plorans]|uniref:Uncharacterized protein n=1 Tax=Suillus plorans TaxID=116603 RepID=A0A9P7AD97_9AGAM|nr:uncharacterized protein HD556DRAFT_1449297 [Suillus plorans]KAG1786948.1 hypothetical protein HD556DRAFT_1449297 [Suillus plorans]
MNQKEPSVDQDSTCDSSDFHDALSSISDNQDSLFDIFAIKKCQKKVTGHCNAAGLQVGSCALEGTLKVPFKAAEVIKSVRYSYAMTSINNTSIVQYHIAISMGQLLCPHCSKKFKTQGFKKHETSCKKQKDTKAEQAEFAIQYARDQKRARQQAHTDMGMITPPSAGPSRSVAGIQNAPPAIRDHSPLADNLDAGDFEAYNGNYNGNLKGAGSLANSQGHSVEPQPAIPPPQPMEFKTMYHPSAGREPLLQTFEEFGVNSHPEEELPVDEEPWRPFCSRGDFEFAEIALNAALNKSQINVLLALIGRILRGESRVTFSNDNELRKAWEHAAAQVTPFVKHDITVPYKKEQRVYETHALPLWDWALDLLANPLLAPHFVWDAQRVFKHNGREFERFYNEPWMASTNQSRLPSDIKAAPFCFILYADKTRLSSHGTVKGYPVVVRCANLPVGIRNGEGIGGGRVVGWLPILQVSEDADEEGC